MLASCYRNVNSAKCTLYEEYRHHGCRKISTLYRLCIGVIARNIERCNCDNWDLSYLPINIKTDLIRLNVTLSIGFSNDKTFIQLLTQHVKVLHFESSIMTDAMLQCIGDRCKNLQDLRIFDSHEKGKKLPITSAGLISCLKHLSHIKELQISESDQVNDEIVEIIGKNCHQLTGLCLNDCVNLTDGSSESMKSMQLNYLNVSNTSITNKWLIRLVDSLLMIGLKDINLKNCKITHEGLQYLNWTRLENINIIGIPIRDLTFIPTTAVYKTLNWSV